MCLCQSAASHFCHPSIVYVGNVPAGQSGSPEPRLLVKKRASKCTEGPVDLFREQESFRDFLQSLNDELKNELAAKELAASLDCFIAMCIREDGYICDQRRNRNALTLSFSRNTVEMAGGRESDPMTKGEQPMQLGGVCLPLSTEAG